MDIIYSTKKLNKTLTHQTKLVRKYGPQQARAITERLYELRGAKTLADMRHQHRARCHELTGNRAGQLSLDLRHPYRLIIEPANDPIPLKDDGGLDWSQVTKACADAGSIQILGMEDTHG